MVPLTSIGRAIDTLSWVPAFAGMTLGGGYWIKIAMRYQDSKRCDVCGDEHYSWDVARIPEFTLVKRGVVKPSKKST